MAAFLAFWPFPGLARATDPLVAHADSARIRGNPSSKVWMILSSDFQCPYCKMWHDSADMTIRREYIDNGKVRLAFVNFPINSHQNAIPAAEYAMCAAAQDKFWQAHDSLFAHQDTWAALPNPGPALEAAHSPDRQVSRITPPCFLLHAEDDDVVPVENTILLRAALKKAGVPVETHIFEKGGHGFGLRGAVGKPVAIWPELFHGWAKAHGLFG